jgi:hypothetical protein
MIRLYAKELRALIPAAIVCSLNSLDILDRPFTERLDEATWVRISSYIDGQETSVGYIVWIFIAFAAYSAFPREHDERTIEFLYALPIRRWQIFATKVAAGLTVAWGGLALLTITDGAQSTLNPQSLSGGQWRLDLALAFLGLLCAFAVVAYAHALLASVFRLFGIIPYVLGLLLISLLDDAFPPLSWADPTSMLTVRYEGTELVIAWGAIAGHLIVALGALALAYAAWMGPADRIARVLEGVKESDASKAMLGCAITIGICFLGMIGLGLMVGADEDDHATDDGLFDVEEEETERFVFTYPASHRERAETLMDAADPIHEELRRILGAERGPQIIADLTESSSDHLGIASWTHVRVGIVAEPNALRCRRTFAHETAHVFQHRLRGVRGASVPHTRFFSEGSAEYLAYAVVPGDEERRQARVSAVAAWERHRMTLVDLLDDERLTARYDTTLVYTLGELWTAALVETHGEAKVGDVWRAIGRPDAPRDLGPRALWQDTMRAAGGDLEAVDAAFSAMLERTANEERAEIEALPRIAGAVAGRDGWDVRVVARLDREPRSGWQYYVRVRSGPDADDTETVAIEGWQDHADPRRVVFRIPRMLVPGDRFQILFSIRTDAEGWPWSETWQWANAPR